MKIIPIRTTPDPYSTKLVLSAVLQQSPNKVITVDNMRLRGKIVDKLEIAEDNLSLEEGEWVVLSEAIKNFPWCVYHKDLLQIIDDVLNIP